MDRIPLARMPHRRASPTNRPRRPIAVLATALAFAALSACGDTLAPFEPEIANSPDTFELQATDLEAITSTLTYTWANSGSQATIDHSTATVAGAAHLTIRDAAGAIVYDQTLVPSLSETSAPGTPGNWSIELQLTNFSGTINFRIEKS